MAYGEALATDSASKKFEGALADNGAGANVFTAVRGLNRRTQNGELVCDKGVAVANQITGGLSWLANFTLNPAADEQELMVDDTVGGVQFSAFHANTTHVLISLSGGEVYYTLRGAAPLWNKGHRAFPHDAWPMEKSMAAAAKFIRGYNADADGKLYVTELIERALLTTV
jgi:hypothetical protein